MEEKNYPSYYKKLSKFIVDKYTYVDEEGYINLCNTSNKCVRTALLVDREFLNNRLDYKKANIITIGNVFSILLTLSFDDFKVSSTVDGSAEFLLNFLLPDLYEKYYQPLISDISINESVSNNKKYKLTKIEISNLLSDYEYMGYDEESAKEDLIELVSYLNNLPQTLRLYRIICSDNVNNIDREYVGSHYSLNKRELVKNHYGRGSLQGSCVGNKVFLVSVDVDKTNMDILQTLSNNILYPHEEEITLKNKGLGVNIVNIEEL